MFFKLKNEIVGCNEFTVRKTFVADDDTPLQLETADSECELVLHFQSGRLQVHRLKAEAKEYIFNNLPCTVIDLTGFAL